VHHTTFSTIISNKATGGKADTWQGVALAGGLVGALSLTGLIIGIASKPTPPPVMITPTVSRDKQGDGAGVEVTGNW
jgi:hypothetical protein